MDKLLKMAAAVADKAEVLQIETRSTPYNIYNCISNDIIETDTREVSLRIIRKGRLGEAKGSFTGDNRQAFIDDAIISADSGPKASFEFAKPGKGEPRQIFDPRLVELTPAEMSAEGWRLLDAVRKKAPEMLVNLYMEKELRKVHLLNTSGADASYDQSIFTVNLLHMFPGSKEGINKELVECRYFTYPDEKIEELVEEFNQTRKTVEVPTKRMPVLFRTSATWSLLYRVMVGVNGDNWARDMSPLKKRMEERIFPEFIDMVDDPTLPWAQGSTPFDDEGVPTRRKPIIEKGVLKNFIFDLATAHDSGKESTGNGFKKDMWGKGIEMAPTPRFTNLWMAPGDLPYREMIRSMEEGVVINDVIGFHAGNMLAGEFSMNVGIGSYVKNGKTMGRAIDTMVAGNIYEDFQRIRALGTVVEFNPQAYSPDILFGDMSVSGTAKS